MQSQNKTCKISPHFRLHSPSFIGCNLLTPFTGSLYSINTKTLQLALETFKPPPVLFLPKPGAFLERTGCCHCQSSSSKCSEGLPQQTVQTLQIRASLAVTAKSRRETKKRVIKERETQGEHARF
ncbi:hypothetical protein NMG60_11007238 [Bertholletia excelsa]